MNVNPGGKVPDMHDTIIPDDNPHGFAGRPQTMQFPSSLPDDHPFKAHEGKPKGMRQILEERGLLRRGMIGDCEACKQTRSRKEHLTGASADEIRHVDEGDGYDTEEEDNRPADCCMRRALSLQKDFQNEASLLQQVRTAWYSHEPITIC